jgi:hypothetical protein
VDISSADIVSDDIHRWDGRIANYYWSFNTRNSMSRQVDIRNDALRDPDQTYLIDKYPNSNSDLYGIRKMEVNTEQGDTRDSTQGRLLSEAKQDEADVRAAAWCTQRRNLLRDMNKDNVVFEEGSMMLKGQETIRAGKYLRMTDGVGAEYYAHTVDQDMGPFRAWRTTVEVERGTGFLRRAEMERSPYERFSGVYE